MMKKIFAAVFVLITAFCLASCSRRKDFDVYLLLGQSNMAGRGTMLAEDTLNVMEGVWLLDGNGRIEPARSPLNKYSTIRKELSMQQVCPGNSFAEKIHEATGRKVPVWGPDPTGLCGVLPPEDAEVGEREAITLVPMGAARLRISAFPYSE